MLPARRSRAPKAAPRKSSVSAEATAVRNLLATGRHPNLAWPVVSDVREDLERMYARRGYEPAWLENARPTPAADAMIDQLAGADSLGLIASDYDADWLRTQGHRLASEGSAAPSEQAKFDVGLSVAAARFVDAIEHGRVPPSAMDVQYPASPKGAPLDAIVDSLTDEFEQAGVLERHQPALWHYRYLKNALARY